jgi:hypothetical protein
VVHSTGSTTKIKAGNRPRRDPFVRAKTVCVGHPLGKNKFWLPDSMPREVLPPQGLFQILRWNKFEDQGKTIATIGVLSLYWGDEYSIYWTFACIILLKSAVSLLLNLEAAQQGRSMLFSDEQKLLFEGGKRGLLRTSNWILWDIN